MERNVLSCTKKVHCWLYSKLWNVHRLFYFYLAIGYHIRNLREIRGRRVWRKVRQWIGPQKWDWHPLEIGSTSLVGCNAPWPARKNSEKPALWWPERQHSINWLNRTNLPDKKSIVYPEHCLWLDYFPAFPLTPPVQFCPWIVFVIIRDVNDWLLVIRCRWFIWSKQKKLYLNNIAMIQQSYNWRLTEMTFWMTYRLTCIS